MVYQNLIDAFRVILLALFDDLNVWWFLAPIVILWAATEIYFGEYSHERLGWNSALANGISLTWINIASLRILFNQRPDDLAYRFLLLAAFSLFGLALIYLAFTHRMSSRIAYTVAGPTPVYFLSILSVLFGQVLLPLNRWITFDLATAFAAAALFWLFVHRVILKGALGELELVPKGISHKELEHIEKKLDGN